MSWRPENWDEIVGGLVSNIPTCNGEPEITSLIEMTADATLKALEKHVAVKVYENAEGLDTLSFTLPKGIKWPAPSKIIFIPDEK